MSVQLCMYVVSASSETEPERKVEKEREREREKDGLVSECCSHVGAMSGLQRSSPGVDVRAGWLACQSHNGSSASQGRVTNKTGRLRARKMQRVRCLHLFLARPPDGAVTRHAVLDAGQFRIHLTASFHWLLWKIRLVSPVPDVSRISLLCSWILSRTEGKKESEQERKRARESERASEGGKTRRAKSSPRKQLLSGRERERETEREGICPPWSWQPESLAVPWAQGLLP